MVDLERKEGQEMDTPLTLPPAREREKERSRETFFNQQKPVLLM